MDMIHTHVCKHACVSTVEKGMRALRIQTKRDLVYKQKNPTCAKRPIYHTMREHNTPSMCAEKDISPEANAHGHDTYTQMAAFSFEEEETSRAEVDRRETHKQERCGNFVGAFALCYNHFSQNTDVDESARERERAREV